MTNEQKIEALPTIRTFPYTIGLRTYFSEEEYQKALHDFLTWRNHQQSKRNRTNDD
jgi:hypothetical protein